MKGRVNLGALPDPNKDFIRVRDPVLYYDSFIVRYKNTTIDFSLIEYSIYQKYIPRIRSMDGIRTQNREQYLEHKRELMQKGKYNQYKAMRRAIRALDELAQTNPEAHDYYLNRMRSASEYFYEAEATQALETLRELRDTLRILDSSHADATNPAADTRISLTASKWFAPTTCNNNTQFRSNMDMQLDDEHE